MEARGAGHFAQLLAARALPRLKGGFVGGRRRAARQPFGEPHRKLVEVQIIGGRDRQILFRLQFTGNIDLVH